MSFVPFINVDLYLVNPLEICVLKIVTLGNLWKLEQSMQVFVGAKLDGIFLLEILGHTFFKENLEMFRFNEIVVE